MNKFTGTDELYEGEQWVKRIKSKSKVDHYKGKKIKVTIKQNNELEEKEMKNETVLDQLKNVVDKKTTEEFCASNSYIIAKKLIKERQLSGGRMGINDDMCNTNLISKDFSPMFIRKFNASSLHNWPLYCSMICDEDVSDIDKVVNGALKAYEDANLISNNLQSMRNLTGIISETLSKHYNNKKENCVEGIAVTLYIDKAYIQSLSGDFMNHAQCRSEYTQALMMMTQI